MATMTGREKRIYYSALALGCAVALAILTWYDTSPGWFMGLALTGLSLLLALWMHTNLDAE